MKHRANDGLAAFAAAVLTAGVVIVLANTAGVVGTATRAALAVLCVLVFAALITAAIEMAVRDSR